jgi:hypothetical protein
MRRTDVGATAAQVPDDAEQRDPEDGRHAHVNADRSLDVAEPVDDVWVARVRSARRDERPGEDDGEGERGEREARPAQAVRDEPLAGADLDATRLDRHDNRGREHDDGEKEVRHDRDRVKVEPHRDQPERRLRDRPERGDPRARAHPARQRAQEVRRDRRRKREQDRKQADDAVPELDERVVVLLREHRAGRAAGPAFAAEPRARQPHRRAADDDHVERERGHGREEPERRRRELEAAHAARLRLDLHRVRA